MTNPLYEVSAIRYARSGNRKQSHNFIFPDDHAGEVSALDFYIFLIRNDETTFVVDTGFDPESGLRRNRELIRSPADALRQLGVEASTVENVILTHMHWDHAGGMRYFPKARFHLQSAEMSFCTGPCMCHEVMRKPFDVEHVVDAVRALYSDRLIFHDGDCEIAPGITLHLIGGHSQGLQAIRVPTRRGWVVLAGDSAHLWEHIRTRSPFPVVADLPKMLEGFRRIEALADGPDHIIPGHEPKLLSVFPRYPDDPQSVRLDLDPVGRS